MESPLGEIVPAEWRVVRLEHTEPHGTRHIIERGMPLDELTTVAARPSSAISDSEIDESWQPGDPLPEYFDESGFPIDPSAVAGMLGEQSAASDELAAGAQPPDRATESVMTIVSHDSRATQTART